MKNFCMYAPAIASEPNIPVILPSWGEKPKIFFPKANWSSTSKATNKTVNEQILKKISKLILLFFIRVSRNKKSKKNFNKKIDLTKFSSPITRILTREDMINVKKNKKREILTKSNWIFKLFLYIYMMLKIKNIAKFILTTRLPMISEAGNI